MKSRGHTIRSGTESKDSIGEEIQRDSRPVGRVLNECVQAAFGDALKGLEDEERRERHTISVRKE